MHEITITKYFCDICKKEHNSKEAAYRCEQSHDVDERLRLIEGSVICPTCHGNGELESNDGCDMRPCYTCDGWKVVIPTIETRKFLRKVGE